MSGPCAKRRVTCVIVTEGGVTVRGENACENPQPSCPRAPGEGYEKCRTVCRQGDHAERQALAEASRLGVDVRGGWAQLDGHYWMCEECGRALRDAGVRVVTINVAVGGVQS